MDENIYHDALIISAYLNSNRMHYKYPSIIQKLDRVLDNDVKSLNFTQHELEILEQIFINSTDMNLVEESVFCRYAKKVRN